MPRGEIREVGSAIGRYDRWINIQTLSDSDTKGSTSFPVEPWTTLPEDVPAKKDDISGRERLTGGELSTAFDTEWEIQYRADMDRDLVDVTKCRRLVYEGRPYDIVDAANIGFKRAIKLLTISRGMTP